ncbi:MAG: glycosyltransferase, partial [Bacillota bacterium]
TLEAISAGLPVIVTDAGGSPEVVGYEGKYSKTVPHGNGLAIGKAIEEFYNDISRFSDNIEYAKSRLKKFSPNTQINQLESLINKLTKKKLRVGIFSSEIKGGAGGASTRVHKALMLNNVETHLITRNSSKKNIYEQPNFTFLSPDIGLRWEELYSKKYIKNGYTIFSLNEPKLYHNTLKEITKDFDIINIQWIARFLSVENIAYLSNLGKPLVITIRDMNPLTGGCHYFHGCDKWQKDCYGCPQLLGDKDNMPAKILELKKSLWNTNNISIITLSNHTKNIVKKSPLFSDCKIKVIGNPIDIDTFSPKEGAKDYFNIKSDDKIIFYIPSYDSKVKGGEELKKSLKIMKSNYPNIKVQILAAGSSSSLLKADDFPFPIINLGHLNDKTILAKAYSAADLTAIPSLEETFSNTAAESVACGTPIVGFDTGAIKDIAGNGIRGKSVPVGDVEGLAEALYDILYSENLSLACREYAEQNFTFIGQGKKYKLFFEEHLENQTSPTKTNISNISELNSLIALDTFYWYSKAIQNKKNKLKAILNSKTYKLGRLLTAPYRKIKNIFKKKNKLKAILNSKTYKLGRLLTAPYRKLKSFFPRIHQKLTKNQTKQITRN